MLLSSKKEGDYLKALKWALGTEVLVVSANGKNGDLIQILNCFDPIFDTNDILEAGYFTSKLFPDIEVLIDENPFPEEEEEDTTCSSMANIVNKFTEALPDENADLDLPAIMQDQEIVRKENADAAIAYAENTDTVITHDENTDAAMAHNANVDEVVLQDENTDIPSGTVADGINEAANITVGKDSDDADVTADHVHNSQIFNDNNDENGNTDAFATIKEIEEGLQVEVKDS